MRRNTKPLKKRKPTYKDPTPKEIARACAEIRGRKMPLQAFEMRTIDGTVKMKPVRFYDPDELETAPVW